MSEATGNAILAQEVGRAVTPFTLTPVEGGTARTLAGALEGKRGAVVVFWSGICSHCVRYDEYLNSFAGRHPDLGLMVIASRHGETAAQIEAVRASRKLSFEILHDPGSKVAREWQTQQTPRCFLVDAGGVLRYRGALDNFKPQNDPDYQPYLEPAIASFRAGEEIAKADTPSFGCAIFAVYYILPKPF
jgi:peroxiredoxin